MGTIRYKNTEVSGLPFLFIRSIQIRYETNRYATAEIVGELEADKVEDFEQRVDESTVVTITTTAQGQKQDLFCGRVDRISMELEYRYARINLRLVSTSLLPFRYLNKEQGVPECVREPMSRVVTI